MPQLVGLLLLGTGLYAGYRALARVARGLIDELREADEPAATPAAIEKDLGTLEYDAASGVYRPTRQR